MEDGEDLDYDESKHDRLLSAVSKLDKTQHIKQPSRNEPTNLNSEFSLIKSSNKLDINNVVKVLEGTAHNVHISKKFKKTHDVSKVLQKPLEKPQRERIKRSTGYEETKKKVGRWDPVVARARTVDYTSFPLKHVTHKLQPTTEFLSKLTLKSSLEMELDEVDPQPVVEGKEEEEKVYPMSYEEMIEHRQHTAKLRAQLSFNAAKAKRQSKIKSKKYHRILKKERLKQQIKEFEELQKTDPEEALKKLEELEKARALERHTLRHKNTGKWAKNLLVRAKYDKDVRQQLAEQLSVSRSLTKKTQNESSDDDEMETNETIPDLTLSQDPSNPWMLQSAQKSNVDAEFDFGYKKYIKDRMFKRKDVSDSDSEPEQDVATDFSELKEKLTTLSHQSDDEEPINEVITINESKKKNKTAAKAKAKKQKVSHKITATSNWTVVPLNDNNTAVQETPSNDNNSAVQEKASNGNNSAVQEKPSTEILDEFETLESNLNDKLEKKLSNMRQTLKKLEGKKPKDERKRKRNSEVDSLEYLKMKPSKIKPIIDEELNESNTRDINKAKVNEMSKAAQLVSNNLPTTKNDSASNTANIDPSRFIQAKPKFLNSALPGGSELDNLDDEEQVVPRVNIEDVFEEDDVVASFRKEKEEEADKDNPKDIDLSLPGWGSWGGQGVKAPRKRKNRFILKAPPKMPRRDENRGDIIIKEYKEPKLSSHKVSDLPFPFTKVKDYEASIRAPLGNTFIPENAHRKLIRPNVITKSGTIIEPMDEEELLVPKNRAFNNENVVKIFANK